MIDFMWHEVFEKEKAKIREDAKHLLEEFGAKLDKITASEKVNSIVGEGLREEGDGWDSDSKFHDLMLLNAPFVDEDFIVAEKGGWK